MKTLNLYIIVNKRGIVIDGSGSGSVLIMLKNVHD